MKYVLLISLVLLLVGCTQKKESSNTTLSLADRQKQLQQLQAWCDSLPACVGSLGIDERCSFTISRAQERFFQNFSSGKTLYMKLNADSLYTPGGLVSPDIDAPKLRNMILSSSTYKYYERYEKEYEADSSEWTVLMHLTPETKTSQLWQITNTLADAGFGTIAIIGTLSDPAPFPSIPDSGYFNWLMNILNEEPAARRATTYATLASKRFDRYPKLKKLFNEIANVPANERTPLFCKEFPHAACGAEDLEKLQTLLYTKVYLLSYQMSATARTFRFSSKGEKISLSNGTPMKELFQQLLEEEAEEITLFLEQ